MTNAPPETLTQLALDHGLAIDAATLRIEEAGLDYQVAFARAQDGTDWVLRVPRREDVTTKVRAEARILELVRGELPVAVPDWRICTDSLIAYPLLPGKPGLTLDPVEKTPIWHFDPTSPKYARALGQLIAALHRIPPEGARAAGAVVQSADELRAEWRSHLDRVRAEFDVSEALASRWLRWLDEDRYWPDPTTFTHGELYPAHVLIDDDCQVLSVLDWTTAKVGDPAVDFVFQHMMGEAPFALTVAAYEEAGGAKHPHLAERCAEITAAGPILYGIFALTTGRPEHRAAAAAQLAPE